MTVDQLFFFVHQGGAYCAPLLLLALIWLAREYRRVIAENHAKDDRLEQLALQVITIATELKVYLFTERKAQ